MRFTLFAIAGSFIISLFSVTCLKGQDTTKATKITSIRCVQVNFSPGYFRSDNPAFNKDLQKEGFNAISPGMINTMISLEFFFRRFLLAPKWQVFTVSRSQVQPNNYESYLTGYSSPRSVAHRTV